jgi:integrase
VCGPELKAAVLLLTFAGARAGEVCRIASSDVDWAAQAVLLRKTKNGNPRVVPLTPILLEALLPLRLADGPLCGFTDRWRARQGARRSLQGSLPTRSAATPSRRGF